jgi:hypothetical protein
MVMVSERLTWFKSSFSAAGNCVEVAFKKSSFSTPNGDCVEAALRPSGGVYVRDTKDRNKPPHEFTADEWNAFVKGVKAGEFDLPA